MPPALEPVEERILQDVQTTLAAIAAGDAYYTTVKRVHGMTQDPLECRELPAICVTYEQTPEEYGAIDVVECGLKLQLYLVMDKQRDTWRRDLTRFVADVKKALRVDHGRGNVNGQANAFDTLITNTVLANQTDNFPVAMARVEVQVTYRHLVEDPTAAV